MADKEVSDAVAAYVRPIRSVLFVDDQFPTFGAADDTGFDEADRARALWRACTARGWLCDVENAPDVSDAARRDRLASSDLLVLDYHLLKDDPGPALAIVRELASHPAPNLVVVYTRDDRLDDVLLRMAATARGVLRCDDAALEAGEELDVEWSRDDLLAFLKGEESWRGSWARAWRLANRAGTPDMVLGQNMLEQYLHHSFQTMHRAAPLRLQGIRCSGGTRWFQCGNLFLTVIGKPSEDTQAPSALLEGLESAVQDWNPSWLACLIAKSRRSVADGSFRDDVLLPPSPLQAGLLQYVRTPNDERERARRAKEVAADLLSSRFTAAAAEMAGAIGHRAMAEADAVTSRSELLELNAFLASSEFTRHHLRLGTVFSDGNSHWICATPACDMAPRKRSLEVDPWAVDMDPLRPFQAIRIDVLRGDMISKALEAAEQGRYVFFRDFRKTPPAATAARCLHPTTGDTNPRLEVLFAQAQAVVTNGRVRVFRCVRGEGDTPAFDVIDCEIVSQLRAPYAERLGHVVGHHLSRIGVNYLRLPTKSPAGEG